LERKQARQKVPPTSLLQGWDLLLVLFLLLLFLLLLFLSRSRNSMGRASIEVVPDHQQPEVNYLPRFSTQLISLEY
jgi:hypothetical protein